MDTWWQQFGPGARDTFTAQLALPYQWPITLLTHGGAVLPKEH